MAIDNVTNNTTAKLSAEQIAFIQGDVSIYAAAGADLSPQVTRAAGCRVDPQNHRITIFLSAARSASLLTALSAQPMLAVVFSQPNNHKALQLKTHAAHIVNLQRDDSILIANYCERMVAHISPLGFAPAMLRTYFSIPASEAVALQFTPYAIFDQTPGPNAGAAVSAAS